MKKILLLLLILMVNGQWSMINGGVKDATTLCIEDKTGAVLKFSLASRPKITFRGNYTVVQADEVKLLQFRNLSRAWFEAEDPDAVNSQCSMLNAQCSMANGLWSFSGFKPLTRVLIYTVNGTLVQKAQTDTSGRLQLSTADLPTGIYVVKAGKMSFKMAK